MFTVHTGIRGVDCMNTGPRYNNSGRLSTEVQMQRNMYKVGYIGRKVLLCAKPGGCREGVYVDGVLFMKEKCWQHVGRGRLVCYSSWTKEGMRSTD